MALYLCYSDWMYDVNLINLHRNVMHAYLRYLRSGHGTELVEKCFSKVMPRIPLIRSDGAQLVRYVDRNAGGLYVLHTP